MLPSAIPANADSPRIVASIKPVHSLVAMVTEGIAEPYLIVKGAHSPHGYAMRPSDAKALTDADVIFWIGPALETFLAKPLNALSSKARIVSLLDEEPEAAAHHDKKHDHKHEKEHDHKHDQKHTESDGHDHGGIDPHVWLDPAHALEMVEHIAETMIEILPNEKARIMQNQARALASLKLLEADIRRTLAPYQHNHVVVLHEAYNHFTRHFGLEDFIALTVSPEHKPGPARVIEIRKEIAEHDVRCVFAEPQFPDTYIRLLVEGTPARAATLDPVGATIEPGPALYPTLMKNMAASLKDCLSGAS
ncbi:MAG: zinc ABC transporter substrate-binding protein [Rhodospirillales bacterium]